MEKKKRKDETINNKSEPNRRDAHSSKKSKERKNPILGNNDSLSCSKRNNR